jgi:hypothetical protein
MNFINLVLLVLFACARSEKNLGKLRQQNRSLLKALKELTAQNEQAVGAGGSPNIATHFNANSDANENLELEESVGLFTMNLYYDGSQLCKGYVAWLRPKNGLILGRASIADDTTGTKCIFYRHSGGKKVLIAVDPDTCEQVQSGDENRQKNWKDTSTWINKPGAYSLEGRRSRDFMLECQ